MKRVRCGLFIAMSASAVMAQKKSLKKVKKVGKKWSPQLAHALMYSMLLHIFLGTRHGLLVHILAHSMFVHILVVLTQHVSTHTGVVYSIRQTYADEADVC